MPLRHVDSKRRSDTADSGCETLDSCPLDGTVLPDPTQQNEDAAEEDDDNEEQWLHSLGIEDSEIRKINTQQVLTFDMYLL